jgi:hypothetical protein
MNDLQILSQLQAILSGLELLDKRLNPPPIKIKKEQPKVANLTRTKQALDWFSSLANAVSAAAESGTLNLSNLPAFLPILSGLKDVLANKDAIAAELAAAKSDPIAMLEIGIQALPSAVTLFKAIQTLFPQPSSTTPAQLPHP